MRVVRQTRTKGRCISVCVLAAWICLRLSSQCHAEAEWIFSSASNEQWIVAKAWRVGPGEFDRGDDRNNVVGITSSTYRVEKVLIGTCTTAVIQAWCFAATVPEEGLPAHAILFLEAPDFPYGPTLGGMFAVDGDAKLSIIPLHDDKGGSTNEAALVKQAWVALEADHKVLSTTEAVRVIANHFAGMKVEITIDGGRRYRRGWVVGVKATKSEMGTRWMVVIDDNGIIHQLIPGL